MTSHPLTRRAGWNAAVVCLAVCTVLLVHARHRLPFIADDALISLRYTARLLAGHGLTWTAGERVEGYSNLLWVLLAAVPGLLGLDLVTGLRWLGVLGMAAAVVGLVWPQRRRVAPWGVGALFFAVAGPTGVWAVAGLETPLVAALLAWGLGGAMRAAGDPRPAARRTLLAAGLPLGLLALTRPDGLLLGAAAAVGAGFVHRGPGALARRLRRTAVAAAPLLAPALLLAAGQLAFRLAYYGDWLPNTAHAKLGLTAARLAQGAAYLGAGLRDMAPLAVLGAAGLALALRQVETRRRALPVACVAAVWTAYVVSIGGDVFPAYRHLVPLALVLACGVALGLESVTAGKGPVRRPAAAKAMLGAALAAALLFGAWQWRLGEYRRAGDTRFVQWGRDAALTLKRAFGDRDPLLAVSAAGCLPYYSGFRSLDILGLCDRYIATHAPPGFGHGPLAHELGDADYVLGRKPDIMIIGPPGPGAGRQLGGRYDRELLDDPRFLGEYRNVKLRIDVPDTFTCHVWLRAADPKLGWRFEGDRIRVPAYFCNGDPGTAAHLDAAGRLVVDIAPGRPALLPLGANAGKVARVETVPADPALRTEIFTDAAGTGWLRLTAARPVTILAVDLLIR